MEIYLEACNFTKEGEEICQSWNVLFCWLDEDYCVISIYRNSHLSDSHTIM